MTAPGEDLRCPVCQALFRGTGDCSRCGADLRRLMRLALSAHAARQAARSALLAGDASAAASHAQRAERCRSTPAGERLLALSRKTRPLG